MSTRRENSFFDTPIRVRWAGWESDTWTLKRNDWTLYADERFDMYSPRKVIELAAKSPEDACIIMGTFVVDQEMLFRTRTRQDGLFELLRQTGIEMNLYKPTDRIIVREMQSMQWRAIDEAEPFDGLASVPMEESYDIRDLKLFKPVEGGQEIYIPELSVEQHLDKILQIQYPKDKLIKKEISRKPVLQAQVFSIAA